MAEPQSFDYVIVGAGSSGCVLANRLSEQASVLLLEVGISDLDPSVAESIGDPSRIVDVMLQQPVSKPYVTEVQPNLSNHQVYIHRGLVLGGCSSINGMIYVRGNRRDYDHWAQSGNEGWSFDEILPYFKRSEDFASGASDYHGAGGLLSVRPIPDPSPASLAFVQAAAASGYPHSSPKWDFNAERQENAAGIYQVTVTPANRRASAAAAFLHPAMHRSSLTVHTGSLVTRVAIQGGRAIGVTAIEEGQERTYRATREVILAAGAFESPKLLMLSGIGATDELRRLGITTLVDLPGVGQNLQDHIQTRTFYHTRPEAGETHLIAEAGLFTNTLDSSGAASPNLQYHFLANNPDLQPFHDPEPHFIVCPVACQPLSRGSVSLRSSDPIVKPVIQPNFLQCEADVDVLVRGLEIIDDLAHTPELAQFTAGDKAYGVPVPGQPRQRVGHTREERVAFVRANSNTVWHPVGTCRMGRDAMSVVDPQLRVHGVLGLRVADASIMPSITAGNTNAPCMMIGEKAADLIKG
jgi:choline dehydrogenase